MELSRGVESGVDRFVLNIARNDFWVMITKKPVSIGMGHNFDRLKVSVLIWERKIRKQVINRHKRNPLPHTYIKLP